MGIRGSLLDVQMVGWNFMRILDFYFYHIFAFFHSALSAVCGQLCEYYSHQVHIKLIIVIIICVCVLTIHAKSMHAKLDRSADPGKIVAQKNIQRM